MSGLSQTVTVTTASESITVQNAQDSQRSGGGSKSKPAKRQAGGGGAAAATPGVASVNVPIVDADRPTKLSPEEQKRAQLQAKFHPSVLAVVDRLKDSKRAPGADEAKFIRNGKAEIQIWLTEKSDETIAALKALGFEVVLDPKTAKLVIGRLPIEKLAALSEMKSVRYVAPQMSR